MISRIANSPTRNQKPRVTSSADRRCRIARRNQPASHMAFSLRQCNFRGECNKGRVAISRWGL